MNQRRITAFGGITDDYDPHHIDPAFAARHSLHGKTIAFGFLTLSMLTAMLYEVNRYPLDADASAGWPANFGFKALRFVAPVMVDARIRGHFTVKEVRERKPVQKLFALDCVVEIEGQTRPVPDCAVGERLGDADARSLTGLPAVAGLQRPWSGNLPFRPGRDLVLAGQDETARAPRP
jgi:acyl dehydratase